MSEETTATSEEVVTEEVETPEVEPQAEEQKEETWRDGLPDEYEFEKPEIPDGMNYDEHMEGEFLKKAHGMGLNSKQVNDLYGWYNSQTKDMFVQHQVAQENSIQKAEIELRADWGRQYEEKISSIQRLVDQYATNDEKQYLETSGFGNDPNVARMMDRIAKDHGEAKHLGDPKINAFTDPDSAQRAKDAFYRDTESDDYKAYFSETHPRHNEVVKMLDRWNTTIAFISCRRRKSAWNTRLQSMPRCCVTAIFLKKASTQSQWQRLCL